MKDLLERNNNIIANLKVSIENILKHSEKYKSLKKNVTDIEAYYSRNADNNNYKCIEWYSNSADKDWYEISCGLGGCGQYYARSIIIWENIRIYGSKVHIGSDSDPDNHLNRYGIIPNEEWKTEIVKQFGEKAVWFVQKYLDENPVIYLDDDEDCP